MKIFLHGALKELSPDPISIKSNRWDLIYRGLESQLPEFRQKFKESEKYIAAIKTDDGIKLLSDDDLQYPIKSDELHLIPNIAGSGVELLVLAAYAGTSYAVSTGLILASTALMINLAVGVTVMLLAPKPKLDSSNTVDKKDSFFFNGQTNVTEAGAALPLVYGEFLTGSVVVSVGLETMDLYVPPTESPIDPLPDPVPDVSGGF